jgi:hypothetical protein
MLYYNYQPILATREVDPANYSPVVRNLLPHILPTDRYMQIKIAYLGGEVWLNVARTDVKEVN